MALLLLLLAEAALLVVVMLSLMHAYKMICIHIQMIDQ
jgi:hypothetical protein